MITVHHLNNSRSQRILWLLEELGLPYQVQRYERDPKTMLAPGSLRAVHPLGKSPVITHGDVTVAESGAIIEYLLETTPGHTLRPAPGTPEARQFTYWLHFAEGSAMPPLLLKLVFERIRQAPVPWPVRPLVRPIARGIADKVLSAFVEPNLRQQLAFMESTLDGQPWFCGQSFTAADIQMSFPLEAAAQRAGLSMQTTPHLADWLQRIHARPAYQRALEKGGPYAYA